MQFLTNVKKSESVIMLAARMALFQQRRAALRNAGAILSLRARGVNIRYLTNNPEIAP